MDKDFIVDFFIVGAPKCGTTAMASYLAQHPRIVMSNPKEPFFFCKDFPHLRNRTGIITVDAYHRNCFKDYIPSLHLVAGEGSVWYLYSQQAAREIMHYNPDAKFLIMLRNPIELVNSLYSMYVGLGFEHSKSLGEALDLENARSNDSTIKRHETSEAALFLYSRIGKLGEQLERLYSHVPREQVKVILYDQFSTNPKACYQNVIDFLGLGKFDDKNIAFEKINAQKKNIDKRMIRYFYGNQFLRSAAQPVKKTFGFKSFGVGIVKLPLAESDRLKLADLFRDDVKLLSEMVNESLYHWLL